MCSDAPQSCERDVYQNYVKLLLSVFYVVCQSLSELRHLVTSALPVHIIACLERYYYYYYFSGLTQFYEKL